jgi:carbon-monoxide dehydrogenase small subunit
VADRSAPAADVSTTFRVNGREVTVSGPPFRRLLDVLREELRLTGSKEGCGEGECGACSAIVNGELVNTCLVPVLQAEGADIITVEALAETPAGAAVQQAFTAHGGAQCGICTPGMVVAATWLAQHQPDGDLREMLAGNLCRCTGYDLIVASVAAALRELGGGSPK